jgi:hypothetical protein
MKTFLVVERQNGGCDYTIGCGINTYTVEAESYESLLEGIRTFLRTAHPDDIGDNSLASALVDEGEWERSSVEIFEIAATHTPNEHKFRQIVHERRAASEKEETEKEERKELARLKAKFG